MIGLKDENVMFQSPQSLIAVELEGHREARVDEVVVLYGTASHSKVFDLPKQRVLELDVDWYAVWQFKEDLLQSSGGLLDGPRACIRLIKLWERNLSSGKQGWAASAGVAGVAICCIPPRAQRGLWCLYI